ncbi:hypothetical protein [Methanosarcina sp. DH1]|uniref:hypothetical protein n=1 Tax=Methanosarcina sp. DH1 TaxID=2605695 RepID=UPI001E2E6A75|nr:hypothetical protein [Methanosarcina sp. DH1]
MRNIVKHAIFLVGALFLLTLNALALPNPSNDTFRPENNSEEPIGVDICIDFIPYNHDELRSHSDMIVIGTVKEILPSKWNTIDGKQPDKPISELYFENIIYTDIIISVDEYLKNPLSSRDVVVRVTGGTVGNVKMTTDADPSFKTGEKVLIYLNKDNNSNTKDFGPEHFIVTNFYRGKYTLTDDGKAITLYENTTLNELLHTINKTKNKANDAGISNTGILNTGILNDTETASKQEQNSSSTQEPKSAPLMSSFWAFVAVIGVIIYQRKKKQ